MMYKKASFKTVNGKESYAGLAFHHHNHQDSISCFKTVNGKESYAGAIREQHNYKRINVSKP